MHCTLGLPHTRENHMKSSIWHENTNVRSNLRKFKWNRLCWVHPTKTMNEKSQLTISAIFWLVDTILATVIISFLPLFSVWQFPAACITCKTHSRTIYYVFRPTSVWLVVARG